MVDVAESITRLQYATSHQVATNLETKNFGMHQRRQNNLAFSLPRAGIVRSLSAQFSNTSSVNVPGQIVIFATLYVANNNSNVFTQAAQISLSPLYNFSPAGTTSSGMDNTLNIPVAAQSRLLLIL